MAEKRQKKVVILGGGVAGLSAAQELVERGYAVEVYELNSVPGGKARSFEVPGDEYPPDKGKRPLPAEHGFRFFPGFYRHLVETMSRIPLGWSDETVAEQLRTVETMNYARLDKDLAVFPAKLPRTLGGLVRMLKAWSGKHGIELNPGERRFYAGRLWQILTSCEERRDEVYEHISWWDFLEADRPSRSQAYKRYLANGPRLLVAADPRKASVRTNGNIMEQLLIDMSDPAGADRVLAGPTNETWIFPWLSYLLDRGVRYHVDARASAVHANRQTRFVTGVTISGRDPATNAIRRIERCDPMTGPSAFAAVTASDVTADYYVFALPVEAMARLLVVSPPPPTPDPNNPAHWTDMARIDPSLRSLHELATEHLQWMNGIVFYLRDGARDFHGHFVHVDSPFALTSVFQSRYWREEFSLSHYGQGNLSSLCSVVISNWLDVECGPPADCGIPNCGYGRIYGKSAKDTVAVSRQTLMEEVWADVRDSLQVSGKHLLQNRHRAHWHLDPAISMQGDQVVNDEPLLVNHCDTLRLRPTVSTALPNAFLASDYVRTHTDLATMEAANEAARAAVNALLRIDGFHGRRCKVWPMRKPRLLAPYRWWDRVRYRLGLPWKSEIA